MAEQVNEQNTQQQAVQKTEQRPARGDRAPRGDRGGDRAPRGDRPRGERRDRRERDKGDANGVELIEKVVRLNRVAKTVKGGRTMRFSALVVVGDGKGNVGCGMGKAAEVPDAIRKGIEDAKKNMISVPLVEDTIPHEITGEFGAGRVLIMPAKEGTGIIAGGSVRAVMEAAGIKNIRTKCLRSNNPTNVVRATMQGLASLKNAEDVARLRGKAVEEL